jgi:hypothetical protein
MKLYTEEQVITFVIELLWKIKTNNNDTFYNRETIKESLISIQEKLNLAPIELPSDDEMANASNHCKDGQVKVGFLRGVLWLKEQILNQNK